MKKISNPQEDIPSLSPICTFCKHFDEENAIAKSCKAFPYGIPLDIWNGHQNHDHPFPGDNGIRFEHFKGFRINSKALIERAERERGKG